MTMPSECGRELHANELRERTVVVLYKDSTSVALTMWVVEITSTVVHFLAKTIHLHLLLTRKWDDTLVDDTGSQIHVYEWLRPLTPNDET